VAGEEAVLANRPRIKASLKTKRGREGKSIISFFGAKKASRKHNRGPGITKENAHKFAPDGAILELSVCGGKKLKKERTRSITF